ncbi:MAG: GntR family transcriptional regulator [Clostridiales bacterium]|nr:GntR family transcriptional regulator [Clostridiales bacterium]
MANYQRIAQDIMARVKAGELRKGDKLETEKELCEKYAVSRITVQKAMKLLGENRMVYRVPGKGTFVGETKYRGESEKKLIGLVVCSFSAAFGMDIIRAIEKRADERGLSIILKNSYFDMEKEKGIIELLVRLNVAGIIIQPVPDDIYNPELVKLALSGFPLVTLDREMKGLAVPFIGSDNYGITRKAVKYLISMGHRNICMFTGHLNDTSSLRQRIAGFKAECVECGVAVKGGMLFSEIFSVQLGDVAQADVEADVERIRGHLERNPEITCAFASEYAIARIIRMACSKLKKKIPDDMSLIAFDNHNDIFRPTMTTYIKQRQAEIGEAAANAIEELIVGEKAEKRVLFDADIIDSGSVRRRPAAVAAGSEN